jgi:hypothetical protein
MYRRLIKGLAASAALLSLVGCGESNLPVAVSDPVPPQGLPKILGPGPAAEGTADSFPDYRPGETSGDSLFKAGSASGTSARPLLRKPSNGSLGAWLLDKQGSLAEGVSLAATVSLDWEIKGVGDFNRDGQPDILWQHKSKRTLVVWLMNGSAYSSSVGLPTPVAGWDLRAVADFDGDGNPDLLWHHPSSNQVTYWRMNKTSVTSAVFIGYGPYTGGPWVVRTAADFFEDGRADIVWQNTVDRSLKVWKWNGAYNDAELSWPAPPAGFEVVAADDCNGDGRPDLLVQNPSSFEVGFVKVLDGVSLGYTTIGISSSARYLAGVLPPSQPAVARSSTDGNLVYGVHDPVRKRLYCSNYNKSRVDVYDEVSKKFLTPIPVGSMPLGIDLTADASRLLVCCSGANAVYSIDLTATTLAGVAIPLPPNLVGPRRPSYLACCSNGRALISSSFDIGGLGDGPGKPKFS